MPDRACPLARPGRFGCRCVHEWNGRHYDCLTTSQAVVDGFADVVSLVDDIHDLPYDGLLAVATAHGIELSTSTHVDVLNEVVVRVSTGCCSRRWDLEGGTACRAVRDVMVSHGESLSSDIDVFQVQLLLGA